MTAREIGDELEVSLRTVYRDLESLGAAGVPVYADRGPAGGYRLLDGYRARLNGLTDDEAEALALAGMPDQAADLGLGTVLASAQLKLQTALPPELRSRAGRIRERFFLDAPGWFQESEPTPHLAAIADAAWEQRRLRVRYRRWRGEVERTLEPLGIVVKGGAWYAVARADGTVRTYRVSRILELTTLPERFERPDDFDLAAYWREWAARFERSLYRTEVRVRLSPAGRARAGVILPPAVGRALREQEGEPGDDGWTTLTLPAESIEHAVVGLLQLGGEVEVLEPPEARERMTEMVAAMTRLYADAGVTPRARA